MSNMTTISVYTSSELRDFAHAQARRESRSISNYIVRLLEKERKAQLTIKQEVENAKKSI